MNKYYKVVDENRCSFEVSCYFEIHYPIRKWVRPKVGKLFCFDSLLNAKCFGGLYSRVFECEVENPIEYKGKIIRHIKDYEIILFWRSYFGKEVKPIGLDLTDAPAGTVLCDAIKLIKEVK